MFPTLLTANGALATFVLFSLAGAGWALGARLVGIISSGPARKE